MRRICSRCGGTATICSRIGSPAFAAFEERMASLEGGIGAAATPTSRQAVELC